MDASNKLAKHQKREILARSGPECFCFRAHKDMMMTSKPYLFPPSPHIMLANTHGFKVVGDNDEGATRRDLACPKVRTPT